MPLNNNYAAYGAGAAPFSHPPPQQHYNESEHNFHDHAGEFHEYHDHQEHAYDDGALGYMSEAEIEDDLLDYDSEASASPSVSFQDGRVEVYSSDSEGGGEEAEGSSDNLFVPNYAPLEHPWVDDSEDEDENEQDHSEVQNPAPEDPVFLNPYESDYDSDDSDNSIQDPLAHISDNSRRSDSSRTASSASGSEGGSPTPDPSPYPPASPQYDLGSQAPSGSDLITISDSEAESSDFSRATASPPAPASASASASVSSSSQGSPRSGPRGPHLRRSPYSDIIDRPSPRLSSLTPVYHPNRRLPRQADDAIYDRYSAGNPDSSEDEPIIQRTQRRPLGIERTRRPVFSNPGRVILDISDEDEEDIEGQQANGWQSSEDNLPPGPRHRQGAYGRSLGLRRQDSPDEVSDQSDHSSQGSQRDHILESLPDYDFGEEQPDNHSEEEQSSLSSFSDEEGPPDNLSQADESGGERQFVDLDNFDPSDEENDEEDDVELAARRREFVGSREFAVLQRRILETRALIQQELAIDERRGWAAPVDRVAPRPAEFLDDSEPGGEDMDLEDELVEVVFDNMGQRHQQRQNNHRPNNQAGEVIDLTNEPDSPEQAHDRGFQNQRDAALYRPPPRHAHRRGQHERGPAIIDLTNDDDEGLNFPAEVIDDDDDDEGLFVRQHIHIPPNRRLPQPIPAPERHAHRNSVDRRLGLAMPVFGNIRRHIGRLGNLGEQIGNFYAAMPGLLYNDNMADRAMRDFHQQAINPDPLANNAPDFNYQANGFAGRPPPPKPQFDEPPPARPGFTRNTGPDPVTGEEQMFICASCDNELMYYDNENDGERPAKRARYKKDREEHHFWAVKACGHVYCKNCYDDRRKVKALGQDYNMAFRVEPSASTKTAKIFCAVDDCQSDVTNNNAWVGIFM